MQANSSRTTRSLRSVGTWFLSSLTSMGVCTCNLVSLSCFWHSVLKARISVFLLLGVSTESVKTILKQVISHSRSVAKNVPLVPGDNNKIVLKHFCLQPLFLRRRQNLHKICIKMAKLSMKNRHLFPNCACNCQCTRLSLGIYFIFMMKFILMIFFFPCNVPIKKFIQVTLRYQKKFHVGGGGEYISEK